MSTLRHEFVPTHGWQYLGNGVYNHAFYHHGRNLVLKIQRPPATEDQPGLFPTEEQLDHPIRSVRLWNLLNSENHLYASIIYLPQLYYDPNTGAETSLKRLITRHIPRNQRHLAWICPFIYGRMLCDEDMHHYLLYIYQKHQRIILDALSKNNILVDLHNQQIVCIDVAMAMLPEAAQTDARPSSPTSIYIRNDLDYSEYYQTALRIYPLSTITIQALMLINQYLPELNQHLPLLYRNIPFLTQLAKFEPNDPSTSQAIRDFVQMQHPEIFNIHPHQNHDDINSVASSYVSPSPIPEYETPEWITNANHACQQSIDAYILSRGTVDEHGHFHASWTTRFFRNTALTHTKIEAMQILKSCLAELRNLDDMEAMIQQLLNNTLLKRALFRSTLQDKLQECMSHIQHAHHIPTEPVPLMAFSPQ